MSSSTLPVSRRSALPHLVALLALVAGLLAFLVAPSASAVSAADMDCDDFPSQRAAQLYFLRHGGPQSDPNRLDGDNNGFACEDNGAPYYWKKTLPGDPKPRPKPQPKPPIVVHTKATLAVSAAKLIVGEPVQLTGRVRPAMRRPVVLLQKAGRSWKQVDAGKTNRRGVFVHRTTAGRTDSRYRLVVPAARTGGKRYTADSSPKVRVDTVRQTVRLTMPASGTVGDDVTAHVLANLARNGRPVQVQRKEAGGWVRVARDRLTSRTADLTVTLPDTAGGYRYRAVLGGFRGAPAVGSTPRDVDVHELPDSIAPSAPTGFTATPGSQQVTLEWTAPTDADLDHYVVEQSTSETGTYAVLASPDSSATSYVVTGLTAGTEYWFRVSAVDGAGNTSDPAGPVGATPTP